MVKASRWSILLLGRRGCQATEEVASFLAPRCLNLRVDESGNQGQLAQPESILNWSGDLIVSFRSKYILSPSSLKRASVAAINFHPGPPSFPGSGSVNWALYEGATEFGVTAHLMEKRVDSGSILGLKPVSIEESDNVESLLQRAHHALQALAIEVLADILDNGETALFRRMSEFCRVQWHGPPRRTSELNDMQVFELDELYEGELERRIRAFHTADYPVMTRIEGFDFIHHS